MIGRRSLLLAGAVLPASAYAQCVTDTLTVDACLGGARLIGPLVLAINLIPNSRMVGAVAGSPGTDPTSWIVPAAVGLTKQLAGSGTENGLPYVEYRFSGTASVGNLNVQLAPTGLGGVPASGARQYTFSLYLAFKAGAFPSTVFNMQLNQYNAAGTSLGALASTNKNYVSVGYVIGDALSKNQPSFSYPATNGATAFIQPFIQIPVAAGAQDFTVRFGAPQLETGTTATSFVPTP